MVARRERLTAYQALQDAYDAQQEYEAAARQQEPAEPPEWRDEAIDRDARAVSRAGLRGPKDRGY